MAHDFRESLGRKLHGGSVSVLAFALLFLPIFLWLGPMWLIFYWLVIFFGYANGRERVLIFVLGLLVAAVPLVLELSAYWTAGVESRGESAISSQEGSYQPERCAASMNSSPSSWQSHAAPPPREHDVSRETNSRLLITIGAPFRSMIRPALT